MPGRQKGQFSSTWYRRKGKTSKHVGLMTRYEGLRSFLVSSVYPGTYYIDQTHKAPPFSALLMLELKV